MIVEDGGAVYTGQALRMKYRNLVEVGLQSENGGIVDGGGDGMESGGVKIAEEGEGEAGGEVGSFDEWDRDLMGDENGDLGEEISDDEGGPTSETSRRRSRQRRRRVELPHYHDDLEGEYDEDDEDFMDGELVGGGGGDGEEDMSE